MSDHTEPSASTFWAKQLLSLVCKSRFSSTRGGLNEGNATNLADCVHRRHAGRTVVVSHSAAESHLRWLGPAGIPMHSCTPSKRWNYDNEKFRMDGSALFHCIPPANTQSNHEIWMATGKHQHHRKKNQSSQTGIELFEYGLRNDLITVYDECDSIFFAQTYSHCADCL